MSKFPAKQLSGFLFKIWRHAWWKYLPGTEITVNWSIDLLWLEKNVGTQLVDWDWKVSSYDISNNLITIKFRKGKGRWATLAALKWSRYA